MFSPFYICTRRRFFLSCSFLLLLYHLSLYLPLQINTVCARKLVLKNIGMFRRIFRIRLTNAIQKEKEHTTWTWIHKEEICLENEIYSKQSKKYMTVEKGGGKRWKEGSDKEAEGKKEGGCGGGGGKIIKKKFVK